MNPKQMFYSLICVASLVYLVAANARGYVPFAGPFGRSYGSGGTAGYFHK